MNQKIAFLIESNLMFAALQEISKINSEHGKKALWLIEYQVHDEHRDYRSWVKAVQNLFSQFQNQ